MLVSGIAFAFHPPPPNSLKRLLHITVSLAKLDCESVHCPANPLPDAVILMTSGWQAGRNTFPSGEEWSGEAMWIYILRKVKSNNKSGPMWWRVSITQNVGEGQKRIVRCRYSLFGDQSLGWGGLFFSWPLSRNLRADKLSLR